MRGVRALQGGPVTCQGNGAGPVRPASAHRSHPFHGKDLKLLTSASALCDFFASVFESVAAAHQQQETACSRNNVVLISTKNAVKRSREAVE